MDGMRGTYATGRATGNRPIRGRQRGAQASDETSG
jgi:hypothetical protein